jgi:hypothetical protein
MRSKHRSLGARAGLASYSLALFLILYWVVLSLCPTPAAGQISSIVVTPEEPSEGQVLNGVRTVRLWTFSNAGSIRRVQMFLDGVRLAELPCCAGRGDVRESVPQAPLNTGASIAWNWGLVPNGPHQVTFRVTDSAGGIRVTPAINVQVQNPQDTAELGAFLSGADFSRATCRRRGSRLCCDGVILQGDTARQTCNEACYKWESASQGLRLQSAQCSSPQAAASRAAPAQAPAEAPAASGQIVIGPEEPADGQVLAGVRTVRLWTYSRAAPITKVVMLIDGVERAELPCCAGRGDVKQQIPEAPLGTGASIAWNWGLVENGTHRVVLRVTDAAGNQEQTSATVVVANPQAKNLGAFLANTDYAAASCRQDGGLVCCDGVKLTGRSREQLCTNVCHRWDPASQDLALVNQPSCSADLIFDFATLAVDLDGNGSGRVDSEPDGIECPSRCAAEFATGDLIELRPTAASGSRFEGWSGCEGKAGRFGAIQVTAADGVSCTAEFVDEDAPTPRPSPTATPSRTPTPTVSGPTGPTPTRTPTPNPSPTKTPSPTPTKTPTPSPSPTGTPPPTPPAGQAYLGVNQVTCGNGITEPQNGELCDDGGSNYECIEPNQPFSADCPAAPSGVPYNYCGWCGPYYRQAGVPDTICENGVLYCAYEPSTGEPIPGECITCGQLGSDKICWASKCRRFNGDTGQFGHFTKDGPGELEAIVIESRNLTTNEVVRVVEKVQNATCASSIPTQSPNISCDSLYKIKDTRPIGGANPGPLCTFDNLEDVNTASRTPASQGVIIVDVDGRQCEARKKLGDQWLTYYQSCCSPVAEFGNVGDQILTTMTLVLDLNGTCTNDSAGRPTRDRIPVEESEPCP